MINDAVLWIMVAQSGVLPESRCAKPLEFELLAASGCNIVKFCETLWNIAYMSSWEGIGTIAPPYTLIQTRGPFYNLFIVVFTNYLQLLEI